MTNQVLKFEDFKAEKLSKKQQKTVHGGFNDPTKGQGNGSGTP